MADIPTIQVQSAEIKTNSEMDYFYSNAVTIVLSPSELQMKFAFNQEEVVGIILSHSVAKSLANNLTLLINKLEDKTEIKILDQVEMNKALKPK